MARHLLPLAAAACFAIGNTALAAEGVPPCYSGPGKFLGVNNEEVLGWHNSARGYKARAYISGIITRVYGYAIPSKKYKNVSHAVFDVKIGNNPQDQITLFFNNHYNRLPPLKEGAVIEACGEFISRHYSRDNRPYMHVLHKTKISWRSGFLRIDNRLY